MDLKNKIVIITGAAQGLGEALAYAFAKEHAHISICDLNKEGAERVCSQIRKDGGVCDADRIDVSKKDEVEGFIQTVLEKHKKIDILINNAGWMSEKKSIEETTDEEYEAYMGINVDSVFYFLRKTIPIMRKQGEGIIITIGSLAGKTGHPLVPLYSATKFAVRGLMQAAARNPATTSIKYLTVAPGSINTDMRKKLYGEEEAAKAQSPEQVAEIILRTIKENSFANGDEIEIKDGAITTKENFA